MLRAGDLLSTLCVEATIHHLDLVTDLAGRPGPPAAERDVLGAAADRLPVFT